MPSSAICRDSTRVASRCANVVAGDVRRKQIVVDADSPVMVVYDDNDRFNVRGEPTTMTVFEAELAAMLRRDDQYLLEWSNYRVGQDDLIAEYSLD